MEEFGQVACYHPVTFKSYSLHGNLARECFVFSGRTVIILCVLVAKGLRLRRKRRRRPIIHGTTRLPLRNGRFLRGPTPAVTMDPAEDLHARRVGQHRGTEQPRHARVVAECASARAADLGIAESTLYPTLAAAALAETSRFGVLLRPVLCAADSRDLRAHVPGRLRHLRLATLAGDRDHATRICWQRIFSSMTRIAEVIFQVMDAYYRLLDSKGQQEAAEANMKNAQTVRQAAEARLDNGLATHA